MLLEKIGFGGVQVGLKKTIARRTKGGEIPMKGQRIGSTPPMFQFLFADSCLTIQRTTRCLSDDTMRVRPWSSLSRDSCLGI